jgi:hypothetical protein
VHAGLDRPEVLEPAVVVPVGPERDVLDAALGARAPGVAGRQLDAERRDEPIGVQLVLEAEAAELLGSYVVFPESFSSVSKTFCRSIPAAMASLASPAGLPVASSAFAACGNANRCAGTSACS